MSKSPANEEDAELRLDVHGSLPEFDLLKFRGSQVIERWSFPAAPSLGRMEALATFTLGHSPPAAGFILERFTLDAFEQLDFLHEPGIVILPESGLATCETIATSSFEQMQETQEQCRKHPGSEIVIESGRSIRLSNPGAEPATLLTLRLQQEGKAPDSVQPESSSKAPPEAEGQMLAFGPFDQELRGPLEVVIQEVYLQPENGMSVHSAVGEEVVLAIDGGVFVSWQGGAVESFASNGNVDPIRTPRTMTAGEALVAHHGSRLAYRNTSDRETTLLVFRIVPAETATA